MSAMPVCGLRQGGDGLTGAIVTAADYRALGVVRSLGRRGIPVWVLRQPNHALAALSRYVARSLAWPMDTELGRVDFLLDLSQRQRLKDWVLIPTDDEAVNLVARHHEALSARYRLTTPPLEETRRICDKRLLYQLSAELRVDQPWTFCPRSRDELARLDCPFPVIIKPALREESNRLTDQKAWRAQDRRALLHRYDEAVALMPPELILVQELIPGGGESQFSFAAICEQGQARSWLVARRTRQYPMDFGRFSTFVETVEEPGLIEPSLRLLETLRYTGLIEVEYKRDPRDGRFKVLDLNPRVWGWHTLGASAGVDFAYRLWLAACRREAGPARARPGVRWFRMSADLPMAIQEILRGRLSLRAYWRSLRRPVEWAIFAPDDPLPGYLDLPLSLWYACRRQLLQSNHRATAPGRAKLGDRVETRIDPA